MKQKIKLNKRGRRVRAILILTATVAVLSVVMNLWWVGDHYCWGSMTECMLGDK